MYRNLLGQIQKVIQKSVNLVPWKARSHIRHIPGIAMFQQWLIRKFISCDCFVHKINAGPAKGLTVLVKLPEDKGLWTGTYECQFIEAISREIRPGWTCLDVGSYRGFIGGIMAINGAKKVICFDPMPQNVESIKTLAKLNPRLCIEIRQEAVGEKNGVDTFEIMPQDSMGKLSGSKFQSTKQGEISLSVQVSSLDFLYKKGVFNMPDMIKIDVEGSEEAVLRGAQRILSEGSAVLFIEAHSEQLYKSCKSLLENYKYKCVKLSGSGASSQRDSEVSHFKAFK